MHTPTTTTRVSRIEPSITWVIRPGTPTHSKTNPGRGGHAREADHRLGERREVRNLTDQVPLGDVRRSARTELWDLVDHDRPSSRSRLHAWRELATPDASSATAWALQTSLSCLQSPIEEVVASFPSLAAQLADAVLVVDGEGVLYYANAAAERLFGAAAEERIGENCLDLVHPGDLEMALVAMISMNEHDVGTPMEIRVMTPEGWKVVEMIGGALEHEDLGHCIALTVRDLTDRRKWELAGGDDTRFRALVQNGVGLTILLDEQGLIATASAALTRTLGHDQANVIGEPFVDLVLEADQRAWRGGFQQALHPSPSGEDDDGVRFEVRLKTRQGDNVPHQLTLLNLLDDPSVGGIIVDGHDITELRRAREELARLAYLDSLTGLPNRGELVRELTTRLRARRPGDEQSVVVAFIDLDRFKPVNDLFGHSVGDELLVALGRRLQHMVREGDMVARLGGDEFVIVADATGDDAPTGLSARLEASVAEPFSLSAGTVQVFASVGAVTAYSGDSAETILAEADAAMYAEKHRRRGMRTGRARPVTERRLLAERLDEAFANDEFVLFYQPIVDLRTGRTAEFEALVRWQHPERGLLPPMEFLDIIEDVGRDSELAEFVLRRAADDLATIRAKHGLNVGFAVNASANQFTDPVFADLVEEVVLRNQLPPHCLTVEVSERSILDRPAHGASITVVSGLEALASKGVRIAVDDFGTGYSSLSHLVSFPIDSIKIDRSFVEKMLTERQSRSIVTALIGLARSMRLSIVAEGVESDAQLRRLRALGCSNAQGYLFSVPLPLDEAIAPLLTTTVASGTPRAGS